MNVALYGRPGARWAMTERGKAQLSRSEDEIRIGPSSMQWRDGSLHISLQEIAVPVPRGISGTLTLTPMALNSVDFELDEHGRHRWWPIAPCARVTAEFKHPALRWEGTAYLDSNRGSEPLEKGFQSWNWSRAALPDSETAVFYDLIDRMGEDRSIAYKFRPDGSASALTPPPLAPLPKNFWRVGRTTRSDNGTGASVTRTLEDTPFYARSEVETVVHGAPATGVHESLDLDRFDSRWCQMLLPFRMPRWTR